MWNHFTRKVLSKKLNEIQHKNPSFSLRAYAQKVGMSAGSLSEFLAGRRRLSKEASHKVLSYFDLTPAQWKKFENLSSGHEVRKELAEETVSLISNWRYFAILALLEIEDPPRDIGQIAKRLGLSYEQIEEAVSTLVRLNLLFDSENGIELTGEHFTSSDGIPSKAVLSAHLGDCDLAKTKLVELDVDQRDFISLTFAGNSSQLNRAKEEIREFRDRLYSTMSAGPNDQVYKISIQLYPLTQIGSCR